MINSRTLLGNVIGGSTLLCIELRAGQERAGREMKEHHPIREAIEVTIVCLGTLILCAAVVGLGTWGWSGACYAGHPGEPVRWTFPGGCELNVAGTWITVGTEHQPAAG